jgi:hypothetical protein
MGVGCLFCSHFLDRGIAAENVGHKVVTLIGIIRKEDSLAKHGIKLILVAFEHCSLNPIGLLHNLMDVMRVLRP